jgi:hypothetical protein
VSGEGAVTDTYLDFLKAKIKLAPAQGFDVPMERINPALKPHTRDIVQWACRGGRRAAGSELNAGYFADQLYYLRAAEREASAPTLFDALELEEAA